MKSLEDVSVNGKRVILRLDLNVPIKDGQVTSSYRLAAVIPTIHFLVNRYAKVIIVSHLGKPGGQPKAELSLRPVVAELSQQLGLPVRFGEAGVSPATTAMIAVLQEGEVICLENIRFHKGEDDNSRTFARQLAAYGDIFVNDALSVSHRNAASVVAITEFLPSYAGLLLEREYHVLHELLRHPAQPLVAVIGGAKIKDKLPVIQALLHRASAVLVGGGVANTFLAAAGTDVKKSLIEPELLPIAASLLKTAKGKLILPVDYRWNDDEILDIGDKTVVQFTHYLKGAKTIFWNGNLGYSEDSHFAKGSEAVAREIAATDGTTVIAGGNTIEIAERLGLLREFSFVSSGGGATLELLGGRVLPGIRALG